MFKCNNQRGFTLIELLIVVAIIGILASVAIPEVMAALRTGNLNAANTEVQNIKTAAVSYYADNNAWPATTDALLTGTSPYIVGTLKARYSFNQYGFVTTADNVSWANSIKWQAGSDSADGKWVRN